MKNSYNIFLIGFMGCGKSTIAAKLSRMYGMDVIEMDQLIEQREKMTIPEIFEKQGEDYFRELESALLKEIQPNSNQIVSCGGGVVLREQNVTEMKKRGRVVLLKVQPETVLKRVTQNDDRPILRGKKNLQDISELMEKRREKYKKAADIIIETDGKSILEICEMVIEELKEIEE